ncbi:hypothetical protein [Mesorhizobium sp. M0408]|uniref:hypothetical protein n=1 Tax=Mesorhizobium sp. M0408 TaxID=2956942 RepID=UPI003336980A
MSKSDERAAAAVRPKKARSHPIKEEDAEAKHALETHDLSPTQARELGASYGNDWRKIGEAAKSYKDD